ncbi:MAG: hypothetical protein K1X86_06055 [Ignavibacteria bacterium]|nr:hypothetical protein [Ignavibacteria bacterium]
MIFYKLPKTEEAIDNFLYSFLQKRTSQYLGLPISSSLIFEGNKSCMIRTNEQPDETEFKPIKSTMEIKFNEISDSNINTIIEKYDKVAKEFAEQQLKITFDSVEEVTKKTGNVVNAKGKNFNYEHLHEMIEKIWLDFDNDGKPLFPTFITGTTAGDNIIKAFQSFEKRPDYKKRFEELLDFKKRQFYDREGNRKLVG